MIARSTVYVHILDEGTVVFRAVDAHAVEPDVAILGCPAGVPCARDHQRSST